MLSNDAFFALLLASRFATARYIPLPPLPPLPVDRFERDVDDSDNAQPEQIVTEDLAADVSPHFSYDPLPSFTYDPLPSFTYDTQPEFTYDPLPSFTYDPPAKRLVQRDNETLSFPAPNPTAVPSAFRTTPLSEIEITSLLDPDSPAPADPTASPSKFRTRSYESISLTSLLDPNGPAPPNPTASPSAFRTRPLSSISSSSLLDPNGTPPPLTTPIKKPSTTKSPSLLSSEDPIAAALMQMNQIGHKDSAPTLLPIQIAPTSTAIALISSVPGAIGPRPLTPTIVNGGTAWVPMFATRSSLNDGLASSAPTTAFQFVSPTMLLSYSAPSTLIAWSLTGKGGTEGGWSVYTTTLPTGVATGPVTSKDLGYSSSYIGFVNVGRSSSISMKASSKKTTSLRSTKARMIEVGPSNTYLRETPKMTAEATGTEQGSGMQHPSSSKKKPSKTASASQTKGSLDNTPSPTSKKPNKTPSSTSDVAKASMSSTKTTPVEANTMSEKPSSMPDQMIGKDKSKRKEKGKKLTGDLRCIYPTPGCDKD